MKTRTLFLAMLTFTTLVTMGCKKDTDTANSEIPAEDNIIQLAQANGFNSLATALTITNLLMIFRLKVLLQSSLLQTKPFKFCYQKSGKAI